MTSMTLADVKAHFSKVADRVEHTHERITVTRHGQPALVLISLDELEALEETLEVLSDPEAMSALRESNEAIARGDVHRFASAEDLLAHLRAQASSAA
jgi:antitoxin YefM